MCSLFNKCRIFKATWDLIEYVDLQDDAVAIEYPQIYAPDMSFFTGRSLVAPELWIGYQVYASQSDSDKDKFARIFDNWCSSRRSCRSSSISPQNDDFKMFSLVYLQEVLVALDLLLGFYFGSDERYQKYQIPTFGDTWYTLSAPLGLLLDAIVVPPSLEPFMPFEIMFSTMKPLIDLMMSTLGYGHKSTIPGYYLLSFVQPKTLTRLVKLARGSSPEESVSLLKGGVASIFEKLVEKDDIDVETLEEVVDIRVGESGGFTVKSKNNNIFSRGRTSSDNFDFVISAIDAAQFSSLIQGVDTSDVDAAMNCTTYSTWRVSNARITYKEENPSAGTINMPVISAAANNTDGQVQGALSVLSMSMAKNGATVEESRDTMKRDAVLYETNFDPSISQFEAFDGLDWMTVDEVYEEVIHPTYFVRSLNFWSCSPWQVLPGQGKDNVWYIGGSVSFDSVETILQYNRMIVDKFCADSGRCRN